MADVIKEDALETDGGKLTGDDLARACANAMWAEDRVAKSLGMELARINQGQAELVMSVRDDMINGHNICHGGYIFILADTAFAYACNGYNQFTVAQNCTVNFVKSAANGEVLSAYASEKHRQGRSGIYDVTVINANKEMIAEFRGVSRTVRGSFLPVGKE
jgi:acyl-CoA thioesterase